MRDPNAFGTSNPFSRFTPNLTGAWNNLIRDPFDVKGPPYTVDRVTQEAFQQLLESEVYPGYPNGEVKPIKTADDDPSTPLPPNRQSEQTYRRLNMALLKSLLANPQALARHWHRTNYDSYKQALQDRKDALLASSVGIIRPLTDQLNREGLSDLERLFLANDHLYVALIHEAITDRNFNSSDSIRYFIGTRIRELTNTLATNIVNVVREQNSIDLGDTAIQRVADQLVTGGINLRNPSPDVLALIQQNLSVNTLEGALDAYLAKELLDTSFITPALKNEMLRYLSQLNLNLSILSNSPHALDEFFGPAYVHAINVQSGSADPIFNIYNPGSGTAWNYQVDYFENTADQQIIRDNIRAAGALDFIYELGDHMGIFQIVDAIVLKWAKGELRIPQGQASNMLYRYHKRDENRITKAGRMMVYAQVLNKGDGELLSGMSTNNDFSRLWESLLSEVVEYRMRVERLDTYEDQVSRARIYRVLDDLQYNLTYSMVGKPLMDVHELHAQFQECRSILENQEIIDQISGGQFRTMDSVVKSVYREIHGHDVNTRAFTDVAVEGNKIFNFIADFDRSVMDRNTFDRLLIDPAEIYINAADQIYNSRMSYKDDEMDDDYDSDLEMMEEEFDEF